MHRFRLAGALLLVVLVLAGCASTQVPMNQPLAVAEGAAPPFSQGYQSISQSFKSAERTLVLVAFSGGGKRSAAFAHGVLRGLRDIKLTDGGRTRTLLDEVDFIAGVSGGSFPAMHYGLWRDRSFETFPEEFLYVDIESFIWGTFLLPWNWEWLFNPFFGTNDRMAQVYDRLMFRGATFNDLYRRGSPLIGIAATDVAVGHSFVFSQAHFDLICSDLGPFPIARAVAASNGFPVIFNPITLTNHNAACRGRQPGWVEAFQRAPPLSRERAVGRVAQHYANPEVARYLHLMDGGIADNLAMRGLLNGLILTGLESEIGLFGADYRRVTRLLVLAGDGQAAGDPTWSQSRTLSGLTQIFSAVSGAQIDRLNFETLLLANDSVRRIEDGARQTRCRVAPVIDGRPCTDFKAKVVHLSLAGISDPTQRARLQAIRTGLSIPREDVDLLVSYGEQLTRDNPEIRALFDGMDGALPPQSAGPRRRTVAVP
jgi:NTE family protein